jgi:hypothetical protein
MAINPLTCASDDGQALGDFKMRELPSRAADAHTIDAGIVQKRNEAIERLFVESAVVTNGGRYGGD